MRSARLARPCAASKASRGRRATRKSRRSRPRPPPTTAIPGVIAAGQTWKVVWHWQGNNADGPIAADDGKLLFANNDASNVMEMDPATGLARIVYEDVNTGGAVSRSKNGALFVLSRGLGAGVIQLEPQRKMFANTFRGEPLDCVGGTPNDLTADARGGVYFSVSGVGVFYANPQGVVSQYGDAVAGANGIILSPDERTLYVTNGPVVVAFDVQADGSLTNQRDFGQLRGGTGGDGSAVDSEGRLYVSTGRSIDVFSPSGEFLGIDSRHRKERTARRSAAATRRRCTASCSTAAGARRARATASSRFRRSRRVTRAARSSAGGAFDATKKLGGHSAAELGKEGRT